ncbi:hypothetical protein EVJ24_01065 [Exiguobacterium sp. SH1S21]|uniref:hypothetical protein n=2 Tax=Exiguobacterium TaxID=33986 RepID=UPI0010E90F4E|nr:hypothetical protein [Exiguobacterium sp. SH31]TCI57398.1 hypothetical protein EVJ24_01065 [Exiguobacterium sp. SH1S21]
MLERNNRMGLLAFFLITLFIYYWFPVRGGLRTLLLILVMISGWLSIFEIVAILEARPWVVAPIFLVLGLVIWKWRKNQQLEDKKSV